VVSGVEVKAVGVKTAEASIKLIQKPEGAKDKAIPPLHVVSDLAPKPEPIQMPPSFKDNLFGKVGTLFSFTASNPDSQQTRDIGSCILCTK
jgi:hypothetical protein